MMGISYSSIPFRSDHWLGPGVNCLILTVPDWSRCNCVGPGHAKLIPSLLPRTIIALLHVLHFHHIHPTPLSKHLPRTVAKLYEFAAPLRVAPLKGSLPS